MNKNKGFTTIGTGFNPNIIKRLRDDVSFVKLKACEKHLILLFDELKIESGLLLSKSSEKLVGFTKLGDI